MCWALPRLHLRGLKSPSLHILSVIRRHTRFTLTNMTVVASHALTSFVNQPRKIKLFALQLHANGTGSVRPTFATPPVALFVLEAILFEFVLRALRATHVNVFLFQVAWLTRVCIPHKVIYFFREPTFATYARNFCIARVSLLPNMSPRAGFASSPVAQCNAIFEDPLFIPGVVARVDFSWQIFLAIEARPQPWNLLAALAFLSSCRL